MPPVVAAPCFAIRRPAVAVFTLGDYVEAGIMSGAQAELLRVAVRERKNILVAGGTSTGKTTLVNALLAEVAKTGDRVVLIEDTRELQCAAPNLVALRTKDGAASLSDLVRSSLRLRPDRIPIGEVRGAEALDLLKAWGTGHPGGVGTLHAGSAIGALRRLEQLIQEAVVTVPRALIAETIDLIAVLAGRGSARRLAELAAVEGPRPDRRLRPHPSRRTVMLLQPCPPPLSLLAYAFAFVALATSPAYAAGSNMPWEQPLNQILESIQGPVAKVVSVIVIIITGLTLAFGETSGGFRRLIQIVFGLSIAFAASSFFLSFFSVRRRSAGLMDQDEPDHRLLRARPSRADRADPARRRAARGRDRQRHARRRRRLGPAALDRRRRHLADRPSGGGLGRQARSRLRRRGAPASALPAASGRVRRCHDEPRRISPPVSKPRRFPALGGAGREGRRSSTRTARSSARRGSADRIWIRRRPPSSSRSRPGSTMRCAASAPAGRSSSRRSASPPTAIRKAEFPDAASASRRCRAPRAVRGRRHAFREPIFPHAALAAAGRGRRARRGLAL